MTLVFHWSLGLVLGGGSFKNRDHLGSRYIHMYSMHIQLILYVVPGLGDSSGYFSTWVTFKC